MAARGGRRQGAPGRSYTNRTDLALNRAPQVGTDTAAAGGIKAPAAPAAPMAPPTPMVTPDMVPSLTDPTARPNEPVTHGLSYGPGGGPEAIGPVPLNPTLATITAAYLANPTPELRRAMMFLQTTPGGEL